MSEENSYEDRLLIAFESIAIREQDPLKQGLKLSLI